MTTVEGGLKDNSPTQARSILSLLVKPFLSVTVSYFTKQWKQKSEWIPPKLWAPKLYHAKNMSHLAEIYRLFPRRITAEVVFPNDVHP